VVSSVNTEETSTSIGSSSSSSPLVTHFKVHSRRYAAAVVVLFTFLIGLAIGGALFTHREAAAVVYVEASTAPAPSPLSSTAAQPIPPSDPTAPVPPTGGGGGRPSGGPGPNPSGGGQGFTAMTSPFSPAAAGSCSNSTIVIEEGPYFVDERIHSGDLYPTSAGLQLDLTFPVYNTSATQCVPLPGAWVDIWEANYAGKYSDEASEGTKGLTFLRGYQVSDKNGTVTFRTTYPGCTMDGPLTST
jgi:hypothetical protein